MQHYKSPLCSICEFTVTWRALAGHVVLVIVVMSHSCSTAATVEHKDESSALYFHKLNSFSFSFFFSIGNTYMKQSVVIITKIIFRATKKSRNILFFLRLMINKCIKCGINVHKSHFKRCQTKTKRVRKCLCINLWIHCIFPAVSTFFSAALYRPDMSFPVMTPAFCPCWVRIQFVHVWG